MPNDELKHELAKISRSPKPFSIYEGPKGMIILVSPRPKDIVDAQSICGKGKVVASGNCSKNDDDVIVLKTKSPPSPQLKTGLKKAFVAGGCSSKEFQLEQGGGSDKEGDESAEDQSAETPSRPLPTAPPVPQARSGGGTPPPSASGWKSGVKPPLPTGPKPTPPQRSGSVREGSESESEEVPTPPQGGGGTPPSPQPGWKPGTKPPLPTGPKPTPPRGGGGNEASESESEEIPKGRGRSDAVSRGSTAPTSPPRTQGTPPRQGGSGGTPPTPPPRTGGTTPKPGGTTSTPPRPQGPPDPRKLEKEAQEHLVLRKEMPAVLTGVLQNYTAESAKLDDFLAKATQHTEEARTMDKSNLQLLDTAIGLVRRYLGEAESVVEEVEEDWGRHTAQGSEMMQARSDNSTLPSTWTPEQKGAYVRESGAAFGAFDKIQRQIQKAMADMHTKVQEIKLIVEEAESYSGTGQDPEVFVKRLVELNKDASDAAGYFSLKLTKLDGSLVRQKGWAEGPRLDEATGKTVKQLHGLEVQAQEKVNSTAQRFEVAARRAEKIPPSVRSNAGVAAGLKQFGETSVKLKKDIAAVKTKQEQSLTYLAQAIAKLG